MERVVNERPFFEGPQINQQRTWAANGTTGASDGIFQDPSQAWYPRRQTGWSRTRIPRGCSGGNCPTQGFGEMPARHEFLQGNFAHQRSFQYQHCESGGHDGSRFHVCHGFLQGKCTYGAACKFQHSESDKNGGFRSYGNENLANAAIAGTSQFSRGKMNDDLGSRRFYPECGSLSPCQKFQSGRCHRGALCPYLHSENTAYVRPRYDWGAHLQEEVARIPGNPGFGTRNTDNISRTPKECDENKGNELRTRSFPREPWGKSPCRNFLKGRCFRGASCPYLHSIVFGKSRDDSSRNRDQQIAATSSKPDFGERTLNVTSRRSKQHDKFKSCRVQLPQDTHAERYLSEDKKIVHERNRTWLMKNVSQSAFSQGNMDISSRSWSSVTQRRRVSHNFGGDKIKTEVCRKFRRGRCDRGESCKYLHCFNEYARSIPDRSNQPHFESSIALRNSGGPRQPAPLMMHKEHDRVRNDNMQLSERKHAGSGLISQDGSFDEKTERQAVNNRVEGIILDQQGETPVLDHHKRKFSGRAVAGNSEFVGPDDDDINSWSQPFKRLRSGHKSPFIARDKYCHPSHSEVVAASVASCSQEVSKDSKLMETNGLDKVTRHGMQLGQCVGSSLDSNTEFLNQKSEAELTKSSFKKENKDSEVAAPSDDSYSHEINKDSDPTETQGYDKVTSQGVALDQCPVGNLDSNAAVFKQKNEAECAKRDDNMSQVKQDGKGLMTGSHGISIPAGKNAIIADVIVSDSTISCEQNHISPVNITVSVLDKDGDTEMNINLSPGGSEKPEASTTNSKKRKRRKRSKRLADPMKEEMTDLATQGTSSSAPSDVSYCHEINKDSGPAETQGYDKVTCQGVALDQCPGGSLGSNTACLNQENEAQCAKGDDMSQVKQDNKGLMTGSHELSISAGENANIADVIVSDSTISCEKNHVLSKYGDASMKIDLSLGGSEKTQALTTNSKKRKRKKRSKCLADPMKEEMNDPATQGTSSSAPSDVSYSHEINKDSDPTETQGYDKVTSQGVALVHCPGGSLDSNTACLNQENEAQCPKGDGYMNQVKQGDRGLMTGSHEIPISAGKNAVIVSDSTISCEKNHIAPVDADVSVLSKDGYTEMKINLIPGGSEKTEALTTNSKKKKRKKRSKCLADPMKVEMTDPATQGTSSSAGETSSSHPYIVSVTGVSDDMTSTIDLPAQQHEQKIDVLINKIQNNIEPALPVAEDPVRVGDSDCCFMRTSGSTLAATSNFKRKLLILDLNGILADIVGNFPKGYKPDTRVSQKGVFKRPFCDDFLEFCFERFDVGVWSSRARKNVNAVVNFLMGNAKRRLLFCWDRSHCTATGCKTLENKDKPLVLKELKKVWEKRVANLPWQKGYYNKSNTVLLDDSPYKALRNPPNTGVFPSPYTFMDVTDNSIGPGGDLRVYLERLAAADHVQKFIKENPFGQKPITESNSNWCFYSKIIGGYVKPKKQKGKAKCQLTPPAPAQKANCQQTTPAPAHKANCQQAPPALAQSANCQQALLASAQNANCQQALLASAHNANCQQTPPATSQNAKCQQTPAPAHKANCQQTPPAPAQSANCQQALLASAQNANCQETPPASTQNANCQQTPAVPAQNANYQQMPSAPAQNTNCQQAPPAPAQNRRKKKKKKKDKLPTDYPGSCTKGPYHY